MQLNVAIVGPGRSKQGTGPYIARTFNELGVNICGVVSSSLASAEATAQKLHTEYGIECKVFKSLEKLLQNTDVDVVVISSPVDSHLGYLKLAIQHNCHIFCEKPLWWIGNNQSAELQRINNKTCNLVNQCVDKNLVLQLNTQWPFTLPAYYEIFPQQNLNAQSIKNFSMWLSPQSDDGNMILDAIPHALSMLYAIVSAGRIENIQSDYQPGATNQGIAISFNYLHALGDTQVAVYLNSSDQTPKPAAYAINDDRVDRHVELPNYLISLRTSDVQVPVMDPLVCSIKNFISSIYSKSSSDETALIDGVNHLAQIYQSVTQDIN